MRKYNFRPKGVLHVGANTGQEAQDYFDAGIEHTFWIEPIPEVFEKLDKHIEKFDFKSKRVCDALISDVDNEKVDFHIANNDGQSSSMLAFGTHSKEHPTVKFVNTITLETARIETIFDDLVNQRVRETINGEGGQNPFYPENYDFLNIDVQGAELKVLKSMGEYLRNFKWAYIEVNKAPLYVGCPMVEEIDEYMSDYRFKRVETKWTNWGWGDCFMIKS